MKQFYLDPCCYAMLEHQNRENKKEECFCEWASYGVLLDNFLLYGKRGLLLFQEHYVNSNQSNYLISFAPYDDENAKNEVWDLYYKLCDNEEDLKK